MGNSTVVAHGSRAKQGAPSVAQEEVIQLAMSDKGILSAETDLANSNTKYVNNEVATFNAMEKSVKGKTITERKQGSILTEIGEKKSVRLNIQREWSEHVWESRDTSIQITRTLQRKIKKTQFDIAAEADPEKKVTLMVDLRKLRKEALGMLSD